MSNTATITVTIQNKLGLHARPAMMFVETASKWPCDISVRRATQDEVLDGKSIMQMMMLAATRGAQIEITATGEQANEALESLAKLIESKFDEE